MATSIASHTYASVPYFRFCPANPYTEILIKVLACALAVGIIGGSANLGIAAGLIFAVYLLKKRWTVLSATQEIAQESRVIPAGHSIPVRRGSAAPVLRASAAQSRMDKHQIRATLKRPPKIKTKNSNQYSTPETTGSPVINASFSNHSTPKPSTKQLSKESTPTSHSKEITPIMRGNPAPGNITPPSS